MSENDSVNNSHQTKYEKTSRPSNRTPVGLNSTPSILADDPEIISKLKELELIKIERQIVEQKAAIEDTDVITRIVNDFKSLLFELYSTKHLSGKEYERLVSHCPWCTSSTMEMEELDDGQFGWKCRYCGKIVI